MPADQSRTFVGRPPQAGGRREHHPAALERRPRHDPLVTRQLRDEVGRRRLAPMEQPHLRAADRRSRIRAKALQRDELAEQPACSSGCSCGLNPLQPRLQRGHLRAATIRASVRAPHRRALLPVRAGSQRLHREAWTPIAALRPNAARLSPSIRSGNGSDVPPPPRSRHAVSVRGQQNASARARRTAALRQRQLQEP